MNEKTLSIEQLSAARARLRAARERLRAQEAAAEAAAAPRHEARAREHEKKRWAKKDYKPGRLAPDSTTQYTKRYKREVAKGAWQKKMTQRAEREVYRQKWAAKDKEAKEQQQAARRRYAERARAAAARPRLSAEAAGLLVSGERTVMTLEECAEELKVSITYAPRVLREYGAEVQEDGTYLRGQVLRAVLVYRNDHPLLTGAHEGFFTYDEAAAYVGVHRDTLKHRARDEQWPKRYEWNDAVNQVCVYFRAAEVHHYRAEHDAWLNAGDSDHTHCLKMRQRRRSSPRKMKRR